MRRRNERRRMRFVWLLALSRGMFAASLAQAEPMPGVLYVAREEIVLVPLTDCPVFQSMAWEYNSGLGCGGTDETRAIRPSDFGVEDVLDGLEDALAAYDVHVTDVRPPPYVPYHMLLFDDSGEGRGGGDCVVTLPNCGATRRNRISIVKLGGGCEGVDTLTAALHAFGRMSGLDIVEEADDPMAVSLGSGDAAHVFLDRCSTLVSALSVCRAHEQRCGELGQNAHEGLLEIYGERRVDREPPSLWDVSPADGHEIPWPEVSLMLDARISDQDPFVPVRWTFDATDLDGLEFYSLCTNVACFRSASVEDLPLHLNLQPGMNYTVTLEASDLHGNVAVPIVRSFSFAGPPPLPDLPEASSTSGDESSSSGGTNTDPSSTTSVESPGAGCSCASPGRRRGEWLLTPVLFVLARRRRRLQA